MAYVPTNWENDPESQTPIDAENLNHMEQGIYDAHAQCAIAVSNASNALQGVNELKGLSYAPIPAATAAVMTDHNKIYVYIGNESGMQNNYWYYWNGSAWSVGGIYNATSTTIDDTLSHQGEAADAKATGDAIRSFGGIGVHIMQTRTGATISTTDVEVGYILMETIRDNESVVLNGMVCGTASANGTVVEVTIYADGEEAFSYSQICNAGLNAVPVIVGIVLADAGNHIVSVECNATSGTFTI